MEAQPAYSLDVWAIAAQPRHIATRDGVFHHLAHHRGQLTVYLRLNDVAVPSIYGPSADEKPGY